jgi:hypothetical protein
MRTFDEVRRLVRAGLWKDEGAAVLLVGFRATSGGARQFRTNTVEGRSAFVPPLSAVTADGETLVLPMAKRDKSPYAEFFFVGRAMTADLVLDDPSVSKSHAAFQREGAVWHVKDARSRNGTYVDGRRLDAGARLKLESGAQVTFGAIATYFLSSSELLRLALET